MLNSHETTGLDQNTILNNGENQCSTTATTLLTDVDRHPIPDYGHYASLGFGVFPIKTGTKNTSFDDWPNLALYGADTARTYWYSGHFPYFTPKYRNVGLALDGLVVVDVDVNHDDGADGFESLAKMGSDYGHLPQTRTHKSPRGGVQYIFRADPNRPMKSRKLHADYPGIDVKAGHGARVLCPGSVTEHGVYSVESDHEIAPMPEWLYDVQEASKPANRYEASATAAPHPSPEDTPEGIAILDQKCAELADCESNRNNLLNNTAMYLGHLAHEGKLTEQTVVDSLRHACRPEQDGGNGLVNDDGGPSGVDKTIRSGFSKGIQAPRSKPVEVPAASRALYEVKMEDSATNIVSLADAVNDGAIPDLFTGLGGLVQVYTVRDDPALPVGETRKGTRTVDAMTLGNLMAHHVYCWAEEKDKETGETRKARKQPAIGTIGQVLRTGDWSNLPPLRRITRVPLLRRDGTILNTPGYDEASGAYFDPREDYTRLPADPTPAQVETAKSFLLDRLLHDFPWKDDKADKANAVAMLLAPAARDFINALGGGEGNTPTPMFVIKAAAAGTGKTLLAEVVGRTYGQRMTAWADGEEELAKVITSLMSDQSAAVHILDNVGTAHRIGQACLAALITSGVWTARILGKSQTISVPNDRLWIATGNNIRYGGDMASRVVEIAVDSQEERPDLRDGFKIPDLSTWLQSSANRANIVSAALVLIRAWVAAGAPQVHTRRRGFTQWTSAMAGLLEFHQIPGFLENDAEVQEADTEREQWSAFLHAWYEMWPGEENRKGVGELLASWHELAPGEWGDGFLLIDAKTGHKLSSIYAGNKLRERVDVPIDGLVLRCEKPSTEKSKKSKLWWVEKHERQH